MACLSGEKRVATQVMRHFDPTTQRQAETPGGHLVSVTKLPYLAQETFSSADAVFGKDSDWEGFIIVTIGLPYPST